MQREIRYNMLLTAVWSIWEAGVSSGPRSTLRHRSLGLWWPVVVPKPLGNSSNLVKGWHLHITFMCCFRHSCAAAWMPARINHSHRGQKMSSLGSGLSHTTSQVVSTPYITGGFGSWGCISGTLHDKSRAEVGWRRLLSCLHKMQLSINIAN